MLTLSDGNQSQAIKGPPNELIGDLDALPWHPNSATGAFHRYLAHLGKTDLDDEERQLLSGFMKQDELADEVPLMPNPILLIENRQLNDDNAIRMSTLRTDIQRYLGLNQELPSTVPEENMRRSPKATSIFNICEDQYLPLRSELMHVARNSSIWIRQYFLKSPDVTVSSREYFDELLLSWMQDPCLEEKTRTEENNKAIGADTNMELKDTTGNPVVQSEKWNAVRVASKYPQESAAICCIVMDEEPYIDEWIDYNYYVAGFDSFFIYDNSDEFVLEQWANKRREQKGPKVSVKHYPGKNMQHTAYPDCTRTFALNHTWVAYFDMDEFIVFRGDFEGHSVVDFLHESFDDDVGQVGFNWYQFGTGGQQIYEPKPVLSRFQFREKEGNQHVKSIVRGKAHKPNLEKTHPHFQPLIEPFKYVSASGTPMEGPFNIPPQVEKASLNHYYYKSVKEYANKKVRGRADMGNEQERHNFTEAMKYDTPKGDIHDDLAWKLLKKHVPKYGLFDGPLAR